MPLRPFTSCTVKTLLTALARLPCSLSQGRSLVAGTRVLSSTPEKQSYTEKQAQTGRPLSPHVTIYDFPAAALSSIANRVTGIALVGGGCNKLCSDGSISFCFGARFCCNIPDEPQCHAIVTVERLVPARVLSVHKNILRSAALSQTFPYCYPGAEPKYGV